MFKNTTLYVAQRQEHQHRSVCHSCQVCSVASCSCMLGKLRPDGSAELWRRWTNECLTPLCCVGPSVVACAVCGLGLGVVVCLSCVVLWRWRWQCLHDTGSYTSLRSVYVLVCGRRISAVRHGLYADRQPTGSVSQENPSDRYC